MWQMTQQGTVSGIGSNCVDLDICTRDYSKLIPAGGYNGFSTHTHSYQAGNDTTHHYQICSCGNKINVTPHSYTAQYKNEAQHDLKCSCQYITQTVDHSFEYVVEGETHKLQCECGYVKPGSSALHSYDELKYTQTTHYYECACGAKQMLENNEHIVVTKYDDDKHYNECNQCGYIDELTVEEHNFNVANADKDAHWIECECGAITDYGEHTAKDEKCSQCGYHYHLPSFDKSGHWEYCESCDVKTRVEKHWLDKNGDCRLCGYKKEQTCEHEIVSGTCTKCGYHEHEYECDAETHKMICECAKTEETEMHFIGADERCTVCGFDMSGGDDDDPFDEESNPADLGGYGGCESSVGGTCVALCVTGVLGCTFAAKKKKKD